MALNVGSRLGHYDVTALIGEGGMGQVYQATDTKLKRQVALKILPEAFSADPDRLARFQREAEVLASLNHPNIAAIYGLEEADGVRALVLELVEGPTLADRIKEGPLPLDEALPIAKQIAEALEAAHEAGVIHRDLKPANIKVKDDGTVKVLDFGLAKALDPNPTGDPSQSPTLTAAATQMGVIMGTAAYMSPEQARGKVVDRRADVWAFGAVLYEMLTGQRAFAGTDVTDTLAAVVRAEPEWHLLPDAMAPSLRVFMQRCLEKDAKHRVGDVHDVRLALEGAFQTAGDHVAAVLQPTRPERRRAAPMVGAVLLTGLIVGFGMSTVRRSETPEPVHLTIAHPGPEFVGGNNFDANMDVSPDGRYVAYVASASPGNSNAMPLYLRALDRLEPTLFSTAGRSPFFSPDGQWVGFVEENRRLSKVALAGGPSVPIGDTTPGPRGATWGPDGTIVFGTADLSTGLFRISASEEEAEVLTTPDRAAGEVDHLYPSFLPGGRALLFTIERVQGPAAGEIALLDLDTDAYRVLIRGGSYARYSESGHIIYAVDGTLRAVPFDSGRGEVQGTQVPVLNGVVTRASGGASFSVSRTGTLAYIRGGATLRPQTTLVWLDRMGREESLDMEPRNLRGRLAVSPDGTRIAVVVAGEATRSGAESDVWVWSIPRRTLTRLSFEPQARSPIWTPDGTEVVYGSG